MSGEIDGILIWDSVAGIYAVAIAEVFAEGGDVFVEDEFDFVCVFDGGELWLDFFFVYCCGFE